MIKVLNLLVLSGGYGTRLKSVLKNTPKALAPINGTPFLELQIDNWINQGIKSFIFLLHYEAEQIVDFLKNQEKIRSNKISFKYTIEKEPLDTGGAILNAIKEFNIKDDFLATNADTWIENGIEDICDTISPSILSICLEDSSRYGVIKYDKNFKVKSFEEKSLKRKGKGYINAGLMKLSPNIFVNINEKKFSIERDLFPDLVEKDLLSAKPVKTYFIDIGVPDDYRSFCKRTKRLN